MRKSKFTEAQIVDALKQVEAGRHVKDMCRELGISEATHYVEVEVRRWFSAALKAGEKEQDLLIN